VDPNAKPVPKERARKAEAPIEGMPAQKKPKTVHDENHEQYAAYVDGGYSSLLAFSDYINLSIMDDIKSRRLEALLHNGEIIIFTWNGLQVRGIIPRVDVSTTQREACLDHLLSSRSQLFDKYPHKKLVPSASKSADAVVSQAHGKTDEPATCVPLSREGAPVAAAARYDPSLAAVDTAHGLGSPKKTVAERVPLTLKVKPVSAAARCKFHKRKPEDRNRAVAETILHVKKHNGKRVLGFLTTGPPVRRSLLSSAVFTSEEDAMMGTIRAEVSVTPAENKDI
jgi:hypothetical protein